MLEDNSNEKLNKILNLLDQTFYNHQQWYKSIIRSLICKLPPDQHDMVIDAHKQCRMGQWYYSEGMKDLESHPGFKALGDEHIRMHQLARELLSTIETGTSITPYEYDNFSNALERMLLELANLRREVESYLHDRDPLTGAINRVNMLTFLRGEQEISKRQGQTNCIVMVDLDHFKSINDSYGHLVGDSLLTAFTHHIMQHLRPQDKIFRYGGEEFLIFLNNMDLQTAFGIIEDLRRGIAETELLNQPPLHITASFGVTVLDPYYPVEISLERADKALFDAKSANRNCTHKM